MLMEEFGKIRAELEKKLGWSRKKLARKLNVEVVTVWGYEGGAVKIPKKIEKAMLEFKEDAK